MKSKSIIGKEISIEDGNKIIAKFMGAKRTGNSVAIGRIGGVANEYKAKITEKITAIFYDKEGAWTDTKEMEFHKSWDWLIPAYNKVQKKYKDKEMNILMEAHIRFNNNLVAFRTLVNYINNYK